MAAGHIHWVSLGLGDHPVIDKTRSNPIMYEKMGCDQNPHGGNLFPSLRACANPSIWALPLERVPTSLRGIEGRIAEYINLYE